LSSRVGKCDCVRGAPFFGTGRLSASGVGARSSDRNRIRGSVRSRCTGGANSREPKLLVVHTGV